MIAIKSKYHASCLCKFYSKDSHHRKQNQSQHENSISYNIVFSETINFIKEDNEGI